MKPCYQDIPTIRAWIETRKNRIAELEAMEPTSEHLAEVRKITAEARDLERTLKALKGNMYPYAC